MTKSSTPARLRWTAGVAAGFAAFAAAALLAQATPAAAAPAPASPSPSTSSASSTTAGASSTTTGATSTTTGATSTTTSGAAAAPTRKPAATAPAPPVTPGPTCTTNADKLYPVICLPRGFGEDEHGSIAAGDGIEFAAQVVNNGVPVTDATVAITLPTGLVLESDEDDPVFRVDDWYSEDTDGTITELDCTSGASPIVCHVGALATHANILVVLDLDATATAKPGTSLTFGIALQPAGTDTYPATSVSATVDIISPAHLVVTLTPDSVRAVVGQRAKIRATVHNAGAGPASDTFGFAIDVDMRHPLKTHFTITNGTSPTDLGGGPSEGSGGSSSSAAAGGIPSDDGSVGVIELGRHEHSATRDRVQGRLLAVRADAVSRNALPSIRFWPIGTIAAGTTRTVVIDVKALSAGSDTLEFGAISDSPDPACDVDEGDGGSSSASSGATLSGTPDELGADAALPGLPPGCQLAAIAHLTAVEAQTEPLANSGPHGLDVQLGVALWALVLGSGLVYAGRRRRSVRQHG